MDHTAEPRRSQRKRAAVEIGSSQARESRTDELGNLSSGVASSDVDTFSLDPEAAKRAARAARCKLIGKRNSSKAKAALATGVVGLQNQHKCAAVMAAGTTVRDLGSAVAVVVRKVLPDAAALRRQELVGVDARKRDGRVRDVPLGYEMGSNDANLRRSYDTVPNGPLAQQLDAALQPLRVRLGVRMVDRVLLQSKPPDFGGRTRRQVGHYDYNQGTLRNMLQKQRAKAEKLRYPWTFLISLQDNGMVLVNVEGVWVVVVLNAGDSIIFRGDVWHCGAAYDCEHWRLHEYWQPECEDDAALRAVEDEQGELVLTLHALETGERHGGTWSARNAQQDALKRYARYDGHMYDGVGGLVAAIEAGKEPAFA